MTDWWDFWNKLTVVVLVILFSLFLATEIYDNVKEVEVDHSEVEELEIA